MILKKLKLVNYRQHADCCVEFDGNLVGVLGPNGSGKSHIFDALHFLFAGRVSDQHKSEMLAWGAEDGSAEISFAHNGDEGVIYRELHSNKAHFQFRGETYTGIKSVNTQITELLGMDPDICKQAVFVKQKEVDAILFTEPSIRQVAWQRLCGLADANRVHAKLGQIISGLPAVSDFAEQLAEGTQRIEELQAKLTEAKENLELSSSGEQSSVAELTAKLRGLEELNGLVKAGLRTTAELDTQQSRQQAAEAAVAQVKQQLATLPENAKELYDAAAAAANEAVGALQKKQKLQDLEGKQQYYNEEFRVLGPAPHTAEELATLDEEVKAAFTIAVDWKSKATMSEQLLAAVLGKDHDHFCPLCKQDLTGKTIEEIARNNVETSTARAAEARQAWSVLSEQQKRKVARQSQYDKGSQDIRTRLKGVVEQIAAYGTVEERQKLHAMTSAEVHIAQTQASARLDTFQARAKALERLSANESALTEIQEWCTRTRAQVDQLLVDAGKLLTANNVEDPSTIDTEVAATEIKIVQARDTEVEIARLKGYTAEVEHSLATLKATVENLKAKKKEQARVFKTATLLTNVRNWFHYSQGPQTVINSLLQTITKDVNDFLARFGSTFYVIADPGTMSFRYCYHDGRPMPEGYPTVSELSGGEAIILAVSFRFATYCLFAGRVGLLALDEPTAYLDEHNVGCFCSLLERVRVVAAGMNLQVLVSTHEQQVLPFLDTAIQCGKLQTPNQEDTENG